MRIGRKQQVTYQIHVMKCTRVPLQVCIPILKTKTIGMKGFGDGLFHFLFLQSGLAGERVKMDPKTADVAKEMQTDYGSWSKVSVTHQANIYSFRLSYNVFLC